MKSDRLVYELDRSTTSTSVLPTSSACGRGLGYRRSFAWRFEVLYIWTRSRNTIEEGFRTADNSIDFRLKRVF